MNGVVLAASNCRRQLARPAIRAAAAVAGVVVVHLQDGHPDDQAPRQETQVHRHKCTGRLVSGTVKFTTTTAGERATLSRGRVIYASGASVPLGNRRWQLLLTDRRALHRGYTLTLRHASAHRAIVRRIQITIG